VKEKETPYLSLLHRFFFFHCSGFRLQAANFAFLLFLFNYLTRLLFWRKAKVVSLSLGYLYANQSDTFTSRK